MKIKRELSFFKERVDVKHSVAETDQICVFYGRDVNHSSCQQVVAKQYLGDSINELLREIKVYTELKNQKVAQDPTQKENFNINWSEKSISNFIDMIFCNQMFHYL